MSVTLTANRVDTNMSVRAVKYTVFRNVTSLLVNCCQFQGPCHFTFLSRMCILECVCMAPYVF